MGLTRREFLTACAALGATATLASIVPWNGSMLEARAEGAVAPLATWVPTTCWIGKQDCGMLARLVDGRIVKLEGHPDHPRNRGKLCPKGQAQIMAFYDPYRLKAPLRRTNAKGVPGEWQEISWEEALTLAGQKIKEVRARNPKLILWQKGRSKSSALYDNAFANAIGASKMGHGAYCSDAGYRALEYTVGQHGVLHPDFQHTDYLLNWGWNLLNAGGNKFCWITWNQEFIEAKERGMKMVTLDPWRGGVGHHTDEWLPIRPGTDLAFMLAVINVLIAKGYVDAGYLKKYTNSPFLVKEDGYFLRVGDKEQVWDLASGSVKPHDMEGIDPALAGEFTVDGSTVKTAYQKLTEHVAGYTPEWAADICGIPADTIKRIAVELGENARIGSKIVLDGVELPYRPVAPAAYHVAQTELGFQTTYATVIVFMLLGAIEAVGGLRSETARSVAPNFKKLDEIKIANPPYDFTLDKSKFFPINSKNPSVAALAMLSPDKYEVDPNTIPEVMIIHMTNPLLSFPQQAVFMEAYKLFKFVVAIDCWMSETADYFADIILPAATIEKYEGPLSVNTQYIDAKSLRLPPIQPLYQTRGEVDIYIDLCEKAGVLYGSGGYIDQINKELQLKEPYLLNLNERPNVRDIFDRWAKSQDIAEGIRYFEEHGVTKPKPVPASKLYAPAWSPPYGGIKHRIYGESLKRYQDAMKAKGASPSYWRDYTALPTWRALTMDQSPPEYDLYLLSHKKIEYKQSRSTFIPLLNELSPLQSIEMNPQTAKAKGVNDGDEVAVESNNAVTGEVKRIKAKVKYTEGIRPDTVSMSHHYGSWVHPSARGRGPTPNELFFTGEGYVENTADQSFHVKVKVFK